MIKTFDDEYSFLSNFHFSPMFINDNLYSTVEHYYQAMKANNDVDHELIRNAISAAGAKKFGRSIKLRPDWEDVKDRVMLEGLSAKFDQNKELAQQLIDTGNEELQEGNYWGDVYWGINLKTGKGKNKLGKFLMQIREELNNE